eukprot:gb/GECH01011612.1/.p1 GENE.gb/GECH01011612.1/~~gb/GECH01011612.1/.p1  ORF type:complete len:575 (+),score=159.26 gb/GECH01011612.1/:1-1725(+)
MLRTSHTLRTNSYRPSGANTKVLQNLGSRNISMGVTKIPKAYNEPNRTYEPGSETREQLMEAVHRLKNSEPEQIPCVINGKEEYTQEQGTQVMPSNHQHTLAKYSMANEDMLGRAIEGALEAKSKWERLSLEQRTSVFLKAADLVSGKYRYDVMAAGMLGQGKNIHQAEIDGAAETVDFWRFNCKYAEEIYETQPLSPKGQWNRVEYRPLEGFVFAVSPFNFTAIGANLPTVPAIVGNVSLWKPSETALLSNWYIYKILREAGLPEGVIQFIPGDGPRIGNYVTNDKHLAGLHFTGSTATFKKLWNEVSSNLDKYRSYPRIVGETGGKNYHFIHETADLEHVVNNTIRGAFEYGGQKCSATSRVYVPSNMAKQFKERLAEEASKIKMGDPSDPSIFLSAVIDGKSFNKIKSYIDHARNASDAEIIAGGKCDDSVGYFVEPTVIATSNPHFKTMEEEIFGPVVTVYEYPKEKYEETLRLCDETSPYGLTGSIFARDRYAIEQADDILRHSAGNFYINDKCTGSVVCQQPFGGARASGTNDKAGFAQSVSRWLSTRAIKENFLPLESWTYPSNREN